MKRLFMSTLAAGILAFGGIPSRIQLPLSFEPTDEGTFVSRGPGYSFEVTCAGNTTTMKDAALRMQLSGSYTGQKPAGVDPLPAKSSYFVGIDSAKWRTNVDNYAKVKCRNVYRGIDLIYHSTNGHLEYDFVVAAGADPHAIRLRFQGARKVSVDAQGDLRIILSNGNALTHQRPRLWQEIGPERLAVSGAYVVTRDEVRFDIGAYRHDLDLVIDPVVVYSTLLGGSQGQLGTAIAVDAAGSVYVTGTTTSADFPTTPSAYQKSLAGIRSSEAGDVFVTKLNPEGTGVVYSTYLGGSSGDRANGIAIDAAGNAYLTGYTHSANFPTTSGSLQASKPTASVSAFVTKLNAAGSALVYSSYLAGSRAAGNGQEPAENAGTGIAVDAAGNAFIAGVTTASDFTTTSGAVQTAFGGGATDFFVSKLNPAGTALLYSTYLGGAASEENAAIAVDSAANVYLTGVTNSANFPTTAGALQTRFGSDDSEGDGVVSKINPTGTGLLYSTYLGGSDVDFGTAIAVDAAGSAFITGFTASRNFPVTGGAFPSEENAYVAELNAYVAKLNASGTALTYSVLLEPGNDDRDGPAIALDGAGNAYITGFARGGSLGARLNTNGSGPVYATYLSPDERGHAIAVTPDGKAYVTGAANSPSFPVTPGAFQSTLRGGQDVFVARLDFTRPSITPSLQSLGIVNAASFRTGPIAPGEIVTVFGTDFGPPEIATIQFNPAGTAATMLAGTKLLLDGVPAPLIYVTRNQLSAVIPYGLPNPFVTRAQIEYQSFKSKPILLEMAPASPAIFTANSSGRGQGAVLNQDFSVNSVANPARPGSVVIIYATGEGRTTPPSVDGALSSNPAPKPVLPVAVKIAGISAEVLYAGGAPGLIAGVLQVNAKVPDSVTAGDAVPVSLTVGGATSPDGVTIAIR